MKKRLVILGLSGSIGTQTIDIVNSHQDDFEIVAVSVGKNVTFLENFLKDHEVKAIYAIDASSIRDKYPNIRIYDGEDGLLKMLDDVEYDLLVNALVGFVGFKPTLKATRDGKDIALANKESLVVGGELITKISKKTGTKLYPIDSEHSAIYQVLTGKRKEDIKRLIITASGGSFRDKSREELKYVTKDDALKHPTWAMGAKITIDSATMMNKGFEIMEAHYLFDIPYEKIDTIMHKESVIHSMVEFNDGSILAQMSEPDMRLPINYALFDHHVEYQNNKKLDFMKYQSLSFKEIDTKRFPLIEIAKEVGKKGNTYPAYLNGANDTAVRLFLEDKISFLMIEELIFWALKNVKESPILDEESITEAYMEACRLVEEYINK